MLTDPQSLAFTDARIIASPGNVSLPATTRGNLASSYQAPLTANALAKQITFSVSHTLGNRTRSVARIDITGYAASVITPTSNAETSASIYLVIDRPLLQISGLDNAFYQDVVKALVTWLSATTYANTTSFLGLQS